MKKIISLFIASAFLFTLVPLPLAIAEDNGCSDCEPSKTVDLLAGQNTKVGEVNVWNDGEEVCVTYALDDGAITEGWGIYETHLYIGDENFDGVLTRKNFRLGGVYQANPIPGRFPYGESNLNGVEEWSYCVPLEELAVDSCDKVYVAAHAVVKKVTSEVDDFVLYGNIGGYLGTEVQGNIWSIDPINQTETLVFNHPGTSFEANWYPNALAYDEVNHRLYFTSHRNQLWFYDFSSSNEASALTLAASGDPYFSNTNNVLGATFADGAYWYIRNLSNKLFRVDLDDDGKAINRTEYVIPNVGGITQGDIAYQDGKIYITSGTGAGGVKGFFSYDFDTLTSIYTPESYAAPQIAFGLDPDGNKVLYATIGGDQQTMATIDLNNGDMTTIMEYSSTDPWVTDNQYQDLASGFTYEEIWQSDTAWGDGDRFNDKGNWGMFFEYKVCEPCKEPVLVNGGFELPVVVASQGWDIFASGTEGLGWTVEWMDEYGKHLEKTRPEPANLELHKASVIGWSAYEGNQYTELDSDWNGHVGTLNGEPASVKIYQDIETCGQLFTLKYAWSPRPGHADNELKVYWDGKEIATHDASGVGNTNTDWTLKTHVDLTSNPNSTTRLEFRETGTADSFGMFLDAVSIEAQ